MEIRQFDVGMADPRMELLDNGDERWAVYTFTGFEQGFLLDDESFEVSIREFVADSRYGAYDYQILDFTDEEYPVLLVYLRVEISTHDKTMDELYKELWPITREMNRINPEDYALK